MAQILLLSGLMFAVRRVEIHETDAGATVTTRNRYPIVAIAGFLVKGVMWLSMLVIFGGGVLGLISPGTANLPTRVLMGLFTIIWAAIGPWSGASMFRRAFARCEFQASKSGLRVRYASFLGTSQREYPWDRVELITEIVTGVQFNRDLYMVAYGRHIGLDWSLSAKSAGEAAAVLSRYLEKYRAKGGSCRIEKAEIRDLKFHIQQRPKGG